MKCATALVITAAFVSLTLAGDARGQARLVAPAIASVTPPTPTRDAAAQLLTVTGSGFSAGVSLTVVAPDGRKVNYAGPAIQARGENMFQVAVVLASAGGYTLTVTNSDGAASEPFPLQSRLPTGRPKIDRVRPEQLTKDPEPRVLTITGEGFASGLSVYLTDPIGTVHRFNASAVGSLTPSSFDVSVTIDMTGDYTLMVTNPSGESSNSVTITVTMRR